VPAKATTWNGSITGVAWGQHFGGGGLVAAEAIHGHDLDPVAELRDRSAGQDFSAAAERPGTRSSSRARPVPSKTGVRSMITVT